MALRIILVLFLISTKLLAQDTNCVLTLTGVVKNKEGNALPSATIILDGRITASGLDGKFRFEKLCSKTYQLTGKFLGYADFQSTVLLTEDKYIIITFEPSSTVLETIEVSGVPGSKSGLTNATYSLTEKELDHFKGKSLGEALKRVPGVSALQTGPAIFKPVIDGLHSQRILILNNGIRQEGQQWGIEHAPEIDPFIASEIRVIKGSETVRYGSDAIGGVIIIDTPPLHQTRTLGGEFNAGAFSNNRMGIFSGMLEGGFKNHEHLSWRVQSSAKKGGDFSSPDYVLSNTGVEELNFSAALGYQDDQKGLEFYISSFNTEIGILRAAHTGNLQDLENSIRSGKPWYIEDFSYSINSPRQQINHQLIKVSAFKKFKNIGKLNLLYGGQLNQRKEFDIRRQGRDAKPALSLDLFSHVLDASLDHTLGNFNGSIGVNATVKDNTNVPGTGIRPLIPDYDQFNGGLFLIEKYRNKNWLFEFGARFDHQYLKVLTYVNNTELIKPTFNFNYVSASLGSSYYITPTARISTNFGISTRPPHVSELYSEGLHHGTASIEEGLMFNNGAISTDENAINNEVSKKWISNLQLTRKKFSIELSAHYNHISNYIYLKPSDTRLTIRGYFPVLQYNQTDAVLIGTDGLLHVDLTDRLEYSGTFAYLYAKDITRNDMLTYIPPVQMEHALTYTFKTTTVQDFYISLRVPTAFKQQRAPKTVYPSEIPTYDGDKIFDFAPPPDSYTLLAMEVGIKIPLADRELSVSLAGENLTNESYRVYMNRMRYFADEPGRNFFFRLKYSFHSH
jgi:iron complex outermembrane recepter protein